jgi:hypothetical protein
MANPIWGRITYGSLSDDTGNSSFTLAAGLSPSVCTIEAVPWQSSAPPPVVADVTIEGTFGRWVFHDCALRDPQFTLGGSPRIVYTICDRRWKWETAGGIVAGRFNWRRDTTKGTPWGTSGVDPVENVMSPRELVSAILEGMGEKGVDVSQIPDLPLEQYPFFDWDPVPSRLALGEVLDAVRCVLTLGTDDKVHIYRYGQGGALGLEDWASTEGRGLSAQVRPDSLRFIAGPTRYETLLRTKPVARELDGRWVDLDKVSYKPKDGWENTDLDGFNVEEDFTLPTGVVTDYDEKRAKAAVIALAQETVYRCWMLQPVQADDSESLADIKKLDLQSIELQSVLLGREFDPVVGKATERVPYVEGQFAGVGGFLGNTRPATRYSGGLSIDAQSLVLTTADRMIRYQDDGTRRPALLFARVAFNYRDPKFKSLYRHGVQRKMGPVRNTGEELVRRDDVELRYFARFASPDPGDKLSSGGGSTTAVNDPDGVSSNKYKLKSVQDNKADVDRAAKYYLDAATTKYLTLPQLTRSGPGLHNVSPNGRIPQVTWSLSGGVPFTMASEGVEHDPVVPPYSVRSRAERERDRRRG